MGATGDLGQIRVSCIKGVDPFLAASVSCLNQRDSMFKWLDTDARIGIHF